MPNVALRKFDGMPINVPADSIKVIITPVNLPKELEDCNCIIATNYGKGAAYWLADKAEDVYLAVIGDASLKGVDKGEAEAKWLSVEVPQWLPSLEVDPENPVMPEEMQPIPSVDELPPSKGRTYVLKELVRGYEGLRTIQDPWNRDYLLPKPVLKYDIDSPGRPISEWAALTDENLEALNNAHVVKEKPAVGDPAQLLKNRKPRRPNPAGGLR